MLQRLVIILVLAVLAGCKSPRFAKGGVFVEDVDRYFNTDLNNANVWLYMDIVPFSPKGTGLKMTQLYPDDKQVMKSIGIHTKGSKLLFSAVPDSEPQYHLIALQHRNGVEKLDGYERKVQDSAFYFQRDITLGRLDIRHIYIPYREDGGLSLIYYISTEKHLDCRFCKVDYLARINALELQKKDSDSLHWQITECRDREAKKHVHLKPNLGMLSSDQIAFLKVYLDFKNGNVGLQYFQILRPTDRDRIEVSLCPGQYYVEYQDSESKVLQRDTVSIRD
ncbi:MAG: hypothetical protein LBE37_19165 [Sphingobacterium sp.]|jgi:hypothetical protein|nr:hypothetical protein [Sphingobacterium sp.]